MLLSAMQTRKRRNKPPAGSRTKPSLRVFLVDDHPVIRRAFQLMLSFEPDLTVCGEADDAAIALGKILALKPDVAVVDLSLQNSSGLALIEQLHLQLPELKILVFSMLDEDVYAERAVRAGASGYVCKAQGTEKVLEALRRLRQGGVYFSDRVLRRLMNQISTGAAAPSPIDSLSNRELQVLDLLGSGLGSRQIAEGLHLSIKTVECHRGHLKEKLGLKTGTELAKFAFQWVSREGRADSKSAGR